MGIIEIEQMARAAGFAAAVVDDGKVIVSLAGEKQPLAVVFPIPDGANGIRVCVSAILDPEVRDRLVRAFSRKPGEPRREVLIVPSSTGAPARFAPPELLNAAPTPRRGGTKSTSVWAAPLDTLRRPRAMKRPR